ncbi:IclR family transcriptional regulator [Amycolatopsis sp. NPDC059657]|uniref:IclR family transcriptional regulator n=1 Tax=Amycolatopsis sp. NPDC059657 TaxID=3346899 RepID=UPI00366A96F3
MAHESSEEVAPVAAARPASPAVDRALTVLETLVATEDGLTLTALARATGIPLATCASIVYTLEKRGYASRLVVGRSHFWRVTLRLYELASPLIRQEDLSEVAEPQLRLLADKLRMPAHVGVLNGASVVYVAKATSPGFIQFDTYPGKVVPFHATALGRAIAAHLPDAQLEPLLTNRMTLRAARSQLAKVRQLGYAMEDEEDEADVACLAAPFFDAEGRVAGSVGVTGFTRELAGARLDIAADLVVRQAKQISVKLGC